MRFNWDAIIPAVALMHEDDAIEPIAGTGFDIKRGKEPGEFTIHITLLNNPADQAEPPAAPAA